MAALLVAACFLLILIARSRLVGHTRRQLLLNFLVALASVGVLLGATLLVDRATNPIQMLEMSYGSIVDDWPLAQIILGAAPIVIAYVAVRFAVRKLRARRQP